MKPTIQKFLLLILVLSTCILPTYSHGCESSLFSPEGQLRYLQFEATCGLSYLAFLLLKTSLITFFCHRPNFWILTLRSFAGTTLSAVLVSIICFYSFIRLIVFFQNPLVAVALLMFFLSLATTFSDSVFALNWKNLGIKQISLSFLFNLILNLSSGLAIYLSLFANFKSFFY